jgi:hypothetical protein
MIRVALLLAISSVQSGCGAQKRSGNSTATGDGTAAAAGHSNGGTESPMHRTQIVLSSPRGQFSAELIDNEATRALVKMLPVTIEMRDHLRQEKTGDLPSPLPEVPRQTDFSAGTLGLWASDDFVIYYRDGRVPAPGIVVLGRVTGDLSMLAWPGPVTVRVQRAD